MTSFDHWLDDLTKRVQKKLEEKGRVVRDYPPSDDECQCQTCRDSGHHMNVICYGGPPIEVEVYCVDCAPERLRGHPYGD